MRRALGVFAIGAALVVPGVTFAQAYPVKPIRILIGTPAGGGSDLMARLIGQQFTSAWGQQVIVEPRPGAGGNIAAEQVARSAPDGYTLYVPYGTHTVNPSLYSKVGYDPIRDFAPIALLATQYNVLVVHPSIPAKTVKELVAIARQKPGRMNYASSGNGSPTHLGTELFKIAAKIDLTHVPYKGAAPSRTDLIGGHVDTMFDVLRTALPFHESRRARILAVASDKRSTLAPSVPTMAEAGYPGIVVLTWHALLAPAGTPANIVERLGTEVRRGLNAPELREKLARDGIVAVGSTPTELEAFMRADIAKWKNVIQTARIRVD